MRLKIRSAASTKMLAFAAQFLGLARMDEQQIGAGTVILFAAPQCFVEAVQPLRIGAADDNEVRIGARCHRFLNFKNHGLRRN